MGLARSGRIVVITGAVVATIGIAVVVTSAIAQQAGVTRTSAAGAPIHSGPANPTSTPERHRTLVPSPSHPVVQVTVPALVEASPTEPLATLTLPPVIVPTSPVHSPVPSPLITKSLTLTPTSAAPQPTRSRPTPTPTLRADPAGTSTSASSSSASSSSASSSSAGTSPVVTTSPTAVVPVQYAHLLGWIGGGKTVSLTFDDGPSRYTGQVLDVLRKYGVKATFCQIGEQVGQYPAVEARIKGDGHTFCDHTWDHDEALPTRSVAVIDGEISRTQKAVRAATGVTPRYYRAPGGDWGATNRLRLELARFRTVPLAWADDSLDWTRPGVATIVKTVLNTVSPGAIILMHDGGGDRAQTIAALPRIITGLRAAGYHFVALPQNPTP